MRRLVYCPSTFFKLKNLEGQGQEQNAQIPMNKGFERYKIMELTEDYNSLKPIQPIFQCFI